MNYQRFNRHSIFTSEDRSLVLDAINNVFDRNTENMLFGLFDGYLYNDLVSAIKKDLPVDTFKSMVALIHKIKINSK